MRSRCIRICGILAWLAAAMAALQPLAAADAWSKVQRLKPNTRVFVALPEKNIQGQFVSAGASTMTIKASIESDVVRQISLARDQVLKVAIAHSGRRWYSIPLAAVAGASGAFAGFKAANLIDCSRNPSNDCKKLNGLIIGVTTVGAAGIAYRMTLEPSQKVIYSKPWADTVR